MKTFRLPSSFNGGFLYLSFKRNTNMKKLVIFDLDGTLLNTIADLAAATNQALQYYGYPIHDTDATVSL